MSLILSLEIEIMKQVLMKFQVEIKEILTLVLVTLKMNSLEVVL